MATVAPEAAVQARDQAFERLYERYVGDVYRYALALLRNPTDAEDVTQTTFMNAYRAFKRGDEIQKPHNWLIKIAHNVARSRYAHASRRVQEVPLEDHIEQLAVPEDDRPNLDTVLRALGRLPFNQRAALVMRELEGRSYVEIADTLGVSVSAVETLIFRARKSLRVKRSELRVLTGVPLPGSLAPLFEAGGVVSGGGVAGGGAIAGASVVGKALVALAVGVVATGVGGDKSGPATAADAQPTLASAPTGSASPSTARSGFRYVKGRQGAKQLIVGGRRARPRLGSEVPLGAGPTAANGTAVNGAPANGTAATAPTGLVSPAASRAAPSPHASVPGVQVPSVVTSPQVPPVQEVVTNVTQNVVNTVTNAVPVAPPTLPVAVPAIPPVAPPAVPPVRTPPVQVPPVQVPTLPPVPPLPRLP
jgi:RNA polymerase sigma factor (sigma-70 family)